MKNIFGLPAKDAIEIFEEKFKSRISMPWQKKIDQLCSHIDFENNLHLYKSLLEETTISCYTAQDTQDTELLNNAIFSDESEAYFVYVILLDMVEYFEIINITITFSVTASNKTYRVAQIKDYFSKNIKLIMADESSPQQKIEELDKFGDKIDIDKILHLHKNTKSTASVLIGIEKHTSHRINTLTNIVQFDINEIGSGETKRIPCPICEAYRDYCKQNGKKTKSFTKKLEKNNKDTLFFSKKGKIIFNCDHEKTPKYKEIPVEIDLKDYKKEIKKRGLNEKDFVIHNYPYFFAKFMKGLEIEW